MEHAPDFAERIKRLLLGQSIWSGNIKYICLYLLAIVAANLITARFGPAASVFNAFILITLDLTCRDKLHEAWHRNNLLVKMGLLIAFGSVLSWTLNRNAGQIALASFIAFAGANAVDTLIYQCLFRHSKIVKMNGSNLVSSAVDSFLFPIFAFGWPPMWRIIIGQFLAKFIGGIVWVYILNIKTRI